MEPLSVIAAANHSIPFMLAVGGTKEVNKTRILEALIIGAVIAAAGKLFALPVLIEQIDRLKKELSDLTIENSKRGHR